MTITIPTKSRAESLKRCIDSIDIDAEIIVVATNPDDLVMTERITRYIINPSLSVVESQRQAAKLATGDILPISDDVEFEKGSLQKALDVLDKNVVGFHTVNMIGSPYAFMLISREYYQEFGGFYEGYKHFFADTEYGEQANIRGRFHYCAEATLKHYHPSAGCSQDTTYKHARREGIWGQDFDIYTNRNT